MSLLSFLFYLNRAHENQEHLHHCFVYAYSCFRFKLQLYSTWYEEEYKLFFKIKFLLFSLWGVPSPIKDEQDYGRGFILFSTLGCCISQIRGVSALLSLLSHPVKPSQISAPCGA